jgi:hypothetical protein
MKATITLQVDLDPGKRPGTKWNRLERVTRLVAGYTTQLRHVRRIESVIAHTGPANENEPAARISVPIEEPPT